MNNNRLLQNLNLILDNFMRATNKRDLEDYLYIRSQLKEIYGEEGYDLIKDDANYFKITYKGQEKILAYLCYSWDNDVFLWYIVNTEGIRISWTYKYTEEGLKIIDSNNNLIEWLFQNKKEEE